MSHKFLVATMPIPGHVAPFSPVVRELLRRGHEVVWYGSRFFRDKIEATGARFEPITRALDYGDSDYNRYFPKRAGLSGLRQIVFDFEKVFVGAVEGMSQDLEAILGRYPAEVLLHDPAVAAAMLLGERGIVPTATLNITVVGFESRDLAAFGLGLPFDPSALGRLRNRLTYWAVDHVVFAPVNRAFRKVTGAHGWPFFPFRPRPSKYLQLQPSVPGFEYPIYDLPPQLHFIGPLLPDNPPNFVPPAWWEEVVHSPKPVVLVTQGTVATNADELIRPTLQALAAEDVLVIATTGGKRAEELSFPIPANARVEPFVPFGLLMPHIDLYVTNGGYGGVTIALANGVPVVSGGTTEDKPEVSNRVAYSGVGLNLKTNHPNPKKVRDAVRRVLADPSFKARAQAIQADFARHDAAAEAAGLLERLAATGQPVLSPLLVKEALA